MIESIHYTYLSDGVLKGAPCFAILLTDGVGAEEEEAIDAILKIRAFNAPGCKLVMLTGKFAVTTQDTIFSMVKSLTDAGYTVGCRSNGKLYFAWMSMLKFNSVRPVGSWLGYKVQEFIWDTGLGKPQLPPDYEQGTGLFVEGDDAAKFIQSSPLLWRAWGKPTLYIKVDGVV
jgi:hypothetical protein